MDKPQQNQSDELGFKTWCGNLFLFFYFLLHTFWLLTTKTIVLPSSVGKMNKPNDKATMAPSEANRLYCGFATCQAVNPSCSRNNISVLLACSLYRCTYIFCTRRWHVKARLSDLHFAMYIIWFLSSNLISICCCPALPKNTTCFGNWKKKNCCW